MAFRLRPDANVLERLKEAGYTTYRLRHEKIMGERAIQKFRDGDLPSWGELDTICRLLHAKPWDIIDYKETPDE